MLYDCSSKTGSFGSHTTWTSGEESIHVHPTSITLVIFFIIIKGSYCCFTVTVFFMLQLTSLCHRFRYEHNATESCSVIIVLLMQWSNIHVEGGRECYSTLPFTLKFQWNHSIQVSLICRCLPITFKIHGFLHSVTLHCVVSSHLYLIKQNFLCRICYDWSSKDYEYVVKISVVNKQQ